MFSYVPSIQTENNLIFVCNICSDIILFVCNISSDMRHMSVCNMRSNITHFRCNIIRTSDIIVFVCNIGSDILYFRKRHKFGKRTSHIRI